MLYSGAELIRASGQQQERLERLNTADDSVRPVESSEKSESPTEGDTQGALLRFARFIHEEGEKKRRPPQTETPAPPKVVVQGDLYREAEAHRTGLFERGQQLDIYI